MLVGIMSLDVEDLADRAAIDDALELAHRGKATLVVAATEWSAGTAHGGDRAFGLRAGERQRFLAPHRLAGGGDHAHLLDMQRMRRRQQYGLYFGVRDGVLEIG